jgi:hypothetical protein
MIIFSYTITHYFYLGGFSLLKFFRGDDEEEEGDQTSGDSGISGPTNFKRVRY